MKVPEQYRLKHGQLASDASYGCNGYFVIPHHRIADYFYGVMVSDGQLWDHVSVTLSSKKKDIVERCPTWEEMCYIKDLFWNKDEVVWQYHPAESDYVSDHHFCLHLWKKQGFEMPTPDPIMVGRTKGQKI